MPKLNQLTLQEALTGLEKNQFPLEELYDNLSTAIQANNKALNVYLSLLTEPEKQAIKQTTKPLKGLPVAVKDNYVTQDLPTTASSQVLTGFHSPYESTVTRKLKEAGGVIVGKTNLDAWAHGSSTETSDFGRTLNPRNTAHLPGGSSGGSAAAIAADLATVAIGSETAGSIRQPAAWCGVVGLKPTYGRVSRFGVIAMASSTDSPGPIAKTVEDASIVLNYIAGHDERDATTSPLAIPDYTQALNQSIKGLKIGLLYLDIPGLDAIAPIYQEQAKIFEKLGATVKTAHALDPHYAISVYTIVQRAEVSSNLARYDGIRYAQDRTHFGDEAKKRALLGTYVLSKGYADRYYLLAQKVRTLFIQDFERLFKEFDVLISPTSPGFAKKIGATQGSAMFGELEDMLLEPSSISGYPGISVPCYRDPDTNLYLGLNIVAPMFKEELMISIADAFEKNTQWNSWRNRA
jgi:aspartyl-tRNA(Asn)/glutamyl-tRNA(Gln) amidotransferase subunit A